VKFALFTVALSLCGACTSYHWLLRPGATGSVIDSQTESPIAGAQITLSRDPKLYRSWYFDKSRGLRVTNTVSGTDGTFSFPPLEKWGHIDTTAPNDGVFYMLSVRSDGYQTFTNTFWYPSGDYPSGRYQGAPAVEFSTNFGKLQLERSKR
jgi:hypothetical protein